MNDTKTYTLVQLVEKKRDELVAEEGDENVNDLHYAFTHILHDCICGDDNIAFTVVSTPDGPLVDWLIHTEEEWMNIMKVHEAKKIAQDLLRKFFG